MRHRLFIPAATALLIALTACTQDELAEGTLPEGEYPVVIRATVDGDWQGVQTVALKMGDAVKEYTVTPNSADNTKATLSCESDPQVQKILSSLYLSFLLVTNRHLHHHLSLLPSR